MASSSNSYLKEVCLFDHPGIEYRRGNPLQAQFSELVWNKGAQSVEAALNDKEVYEVWFGNKVYIEEEMEVQDTLSGLETIPSTVRVTKQDVVQKHRNWVWMRRQLVWRLRPPSKVEKLAEAWTKRIHDYYHALPYRDLDQSERAKVLVDTNINLTHAMIDCLDGYPVPLLRTVRNLAIHRYVFGKHKIQCHDVEVAIGEFGPACRGILPELFNEDATLLEDKKLLEDILEYVHVTASLALAAIWRCWPQKVPGEWLKPGGLEDAVKKNDKLLMALREQYPTARLGQLITFGHLEQEAMRPAASDDTWEWAVGERDTAAGEIKKRLWPERNRLSEMWLQQMIEHIPKYKEVMTKEEPGEKKVKEFNKDLCDALLLGLDCSWLPLLYAISKLVKVRAPTQSTEKIAIDDVLKALGLFKNVCRVFLNEQEQTTLENHPEIEVLLENQVDAAKCVLQTLWWVSDQEQLTSKLADENALLKNYAKLRKDKAAQENLLACMNLALDDDGPDGCYGARDVAEVQKEADRSAGQTKIEEELKPKPKEEKLKYGYYKDLMKMFHEDTSNEWRFAVLPPPPDSTAPPPEPPGPQHYWRLRDNAGIGDEDEDDEMWEEMRQEGEKQKDDDELGCVGVLLEYLSEPGHPPPPPCQSLGLDPHPLPYPQDSTSTSLPHP